MSRKIRILLLEKVAGLGEAGALVTTAEGYARNFLFPQGKAALAHDTTVAREATRRERTVKASQLHLTELRQLAQSLSGTELTIRALVKDGDEIFGSLPASRLARELNAQAKLKVRAPDVLLAAPIKRLGTYDVTIRLAPDVETDIKVVVEADTQTPSPDAAV